MSETADNASLAGVRIGILHHAGSRLLRRGYLIELMADQWAARGAAVVDIVGIETAVPVDVLLLHVDLSIVPDEYLHFAKSYSSVINLEAVDIRKTSYLDDLVGAEGDWDGPVIVKSDLNHGGLPERLLTPGKTRLGGRLAGVLRRIRRLLGLPNEIRAKADYAVFPDRASIPARRFHDGSIIQPFRSERSGSDFVLREYYFFGGIAILNKEIGPDPILTSGRQVECRAESPPPEVRAVRDRLNLDYGKIDYGCPDGVTVVYDANKTLGIRRNPGEVTTMIASALAKGIDGWIRHDDLT